MEVTTEQLRMLLNLTEINEERAAFLLEMAANLARTVIDPLPDGAEAVVLSVAARCYNNPQMLTGSETIGPYTGPTRAEGGLYLKRDERRTLHRLAGRGGAFTVDPTPVDAGPVYPPVVDPWGSW
ncbi:hypothetical protein [Nocardiopsis dassonvillei]|uniref:hypothetical protein n=1 Tax=Nocardiopsis dassonvillei TaxID=2014 RepID=UPI00157CE562|nr:hypothetical protein [Nocardiopsis dassonvillei]